MARPRRSPHRGHWRPTIWDYVLRRDLERWHNIPRVPAGAFTSLFSLSSPDGVNPEAALLLAPNRLLYGVASAGGATVTAPSSRSPRRDAHGAAHVRSYRRRLAIGLVQAFNGTLYGTTYRGGTQQNGTIFKITPGGALTTMHNFARATTFPHSPRRPGKQRAAYGTTF